jgi:hypothetical protein
MVFNFFVGAVVVCGVFVLLCWLADTVFGEETEHLSNPEPQPAEFEASPVTQKRHLQLVHSAPRETTSDEKALLHEIHSQNCCTLYDQATNSKI